MNSRTLVVLVAASLALGSCSKWQHGVAVNGTVFSQVKIDDHGFTIGLLTRETVIGDRLCKQGWVHMHPNGVVAAFTASEPVPFGKFMIQSDTWVKQDERGIVTICAFPRATDVQGHWCRGTGGPKGVQTAFYPGGTLKQYYPVCDVLIDGMPCRAGAFNGWIELHENGRLKSALLDADLEREGQHYRRGTRVEFDTEGRIVPKVDSPVEIRIGECGMAS